MNINRFMLLAICNICISLATFSQTAKSYAATRVIGNTGPQTVPSMSMTLEYHEGYLLFNGIEKYVLSRRNYDGSMLYQPTKYGNPTLRTVGILVSNDYSTVRQFTQSTIMGMTMELTYDFSYIGDGYEAAQNYILSGSPQFSEDAENNIRNNCSSCGGSGRCKYCGGTGKDESTRNGRCGVCRGNGRCVGCDGKGGYHY